MGVQALVLNASFEPLVVVSWQKAIQLLFQGKVEVIEESESEVRTVKLTLKIPAVIRLLKYIPASKKKQIIRFSRANIFARDEHRCQYCGHRFSKTQLTLDHVIPVVQGGKKTWTNIVTSCKTCNQRKGGRTPSQASMQLIRKPKEPTWLPGMHLHFQWSGVPDRWKIYLEVQKHS
jgi:5-methylcytosine-specific restriction endonuclease McrA